MGESLKVICGRLRDIWPYLAGAVFLLIAGAALKYLPEMQVPKEAYWLDTKTIFDMKNEARRTISYIIGGLLAVIGIILTFRRIRALERQVLVAQEGQITERFTRAIEQLGSSEMAIRLGGIYALERIANDSDKDYWSIMETLTAYIRERAPWKGQLQDANMDELAEEQEVAQIPSILIEAKIKPATDIQAVLTVLARRKYHYGFKEDNSLNLSKTYLQGANLPGANLERAVLDGANLENALIVRSNLNKAFLREVRLDRAHLDETHIKSAILDDANLTGADLQGSHLEGARLWAAHLEGAFLRGAYLEGADLKGAHLEGAYLGESTGLTWEQLNKATIDENTILPDYLQEQPQKASGPKGNDKE